MTGNLTYITSYSGFLELEWHIAISEVIAELDVPIPAYISHWFNFLDGTFYLTMTRPEQIDDVSELSFFLTKVSLSCPISFMCESQLKDEHDSFTIDFMGNYHFSERIPEVIIRRKPSESDINNKLSEMNPEEYLIFHCKFTEIAGKYENYKFIYS